MISVETSGAVISVEVANGDDSPGVIAGASQATHTVPRYVLVGVPISQL